MRSLPLFVKLTGRSVILLGEGYMADAKARLLTRAGAIIVGEDAPASLAVVALSDAGEAEAAAARLKARGMLVNVVDRLELSDFTFPAIVDRDPVLVAVGTGGVSAGIAAALRQRLETVLPASLGRVADAFNAARGDMKRRFPTLDDRRRVIAGLVQAGGPLDPLREAADPARAIADAGLPESRIETIAVTSADPDELTLRAARLLGIADRLFHDGSIPAGILDRARSDCERIAGAPPAVPPPGVSVVLTWRAA